MPFTKEFKQCPNCGSTNTIAMDTIKEDALSKNKDIPITLMMQQSVIADPSTIYNRITVPVVSFCTDICSDCGTLYAKYINITNEMASNVLPSKGMFKGK